ncbi:MAG: hypothetical protein HRT35_35085 [Algicola sp.]|nr:hypothetical protein [Algicola sp.]
MTQVFDALHWSGDAGVGSLGSGSLLSPMPSLSLSVVSVGSVGKASALSPVPSLSVAVG